MVKIPEAVWVVKRKTSRVKEIFPLANTFYICRIEVMDYSLTASEVARETKLTPERVRQLARKNVIEGRQAGLVWLFPASVVDVIKNRPDNRGGRPRKVTESLHAFKAPDGSWRSK